MKRFHQLFTLSLIDKISARVVLVAIASLILMMVLITVEVVLRKFFSTSTKIAHDFSAHFYVAIVLFGLAETLAAGKHLRVTVFLDRFQRQVRSVINKINAIIGIILILLLLWFSTGFVISSYERGGMIGTIVEIPEFIPEMFIPVGLFFFTLQLFVHLIREFKGGISDKDTPGGIFDNE